MEADLKENELVEDDEEFVFLDLTNACGQTDIPTNTPYVLSGLNTENPILVIGDNLKLIGEYQETIGSCFVFSETMDSASKLHDQRQSSDKNSSAGKCKLDSSQALTKQVTPVARLQKILKFRLLSEDKNSGVETERSASTK